MKNEQAFPGPQKNGFQEGMTKLEYFSLHAPNEIPGWFLGKQSDRPFPEFPDFTRAQTEEDRKLLQNWRDDPCYDLPGHLLWYQEEVNAHIDARNEATLKRNIDTYFKWRIFFAETLLKNINETIPKPVFDRREDKA